MKIKKNGNVLSASRKTNIVMIIASLCFVLFGLAVYQYSSNTIGSIIIFFSSIFSIGVYNQGFTKIILHSEQLEVVALFGKRVFQKESIKKTTWEKGGGVLLQLTNDSWVTIPDLGNSQSVCNSVRAWLKNA